MYADLGPGQTIDFDPPSPNGVDLLYSHEYVALRLKQMGTNLYTYAGNNPVNYVDPSGLNPLPGHGKFCGPRTAGAGVPGIDCIDKACKRHDKCIGTFSLCLLTPFKITKCDYKLSTEAYYCAAFGCKTVLCQYWAMNIAIEMGHPLWGTIPFRRSFFPWT